MSPLLARQRLDRIRADTVKRHQSHTALLSHQMQIRQSQDSMTREAEYNRLLGAQTVAHAALPQHAKHRLVELKNLLNK